MTNDAFWRAVYHLEANNDGWLHATSGLRCKVFVDGVQILRVTKANRELGVVERAVVCGDGRLLINGRRDGIVTQMIEGKVVIEPFPNDETEELK